MAACVAVACGLLQAREIDAAAYRTLRNAFQAGSGAFKGEVAGAMRDGKVSRWDYTGLMRDYWSENKSLAIGFGATNVAQERLLLAAATRQITSGH
jgi:hypothetical protein